MASQSVVQRQKSMVQVEQAALQHAEPIEAALAAAVEMAPGEAAPQVAGLLRGLARGLRRSCESLVQADTAHEDELLDDAGPRAERDAAAAAAAAAVSILREGLRVTRGAAAEAMLGVVGPTPRQPEAILLVGRQVLPRVDGAAALPEVAAGFRFDPAPAKTSLADALTRLDTALIDVSREKKEADVTLVGKYAAEETFDRQFSQVANLLSVLLEGIGEHELAARVRPSRRRSGLTTAVDEAPEPPTEA